MPETTPIIMYGTGWCGDCTRSKRTFARLGQDYEYIDIESDEAGSAEAQRISGAMRIPVIVFPDGDFLVEPSDKALSDKVLAVRD
ncbi:MAG: glutaredoxin family protein [Glaciihabitans sp.]|nr:glutaredoxin family protein [Glaciihabitans sp.]